MIRFEWQGACAFATLDRPEARSALDDAMVHALHQACEAVAARDDARALVIRGGGGHFCAGGDFGAFKTLIATPAPATGADPIATMNRRFGSLLQALAALDVPTIAVVEGAAMGGGVGLAAVCDFVLASATARFATPEVSLGLPPAQIAPFVVRRVGDMQARRLLLTARSFDADAALQLGLVDEIAADAVALEKLLAERLAQLGRAEPRALRETKRLLVMMRESSLGATLDAGALAFARALRGGAPLEGMAAFAEKRAAAWVADPSPLPSPRRGEGETPSTACGKGLG